MKLIELLIKSSNREELPKKIEFEGDIFELDDTDKTYRSENGNFLTDSINFNLSNLNDEVEIIEDEKEIQSIETLNPHDEYFRDGTELVYKLMYNKINEIAMKVNQLDKKVNSIEQK